MRISDWSSDVCSSDLLHRLEAAVVGIARRRTGNGGVLRPRAALAGGKPGAAARVAWRLRARCAGVHPLPRPGPRSEEHTSELQSLMRLSYAVFCLKKKIDSKYVHSIIIHT